MTNKNDIEKLFKAHYQQMHRLAVALLHDDDSARDIVHDVFASILGSCPAGVSPLGSGCGDVVVTPGYLLSAVRNRCLNLIRDNGVCDRVINRYFIENDEYDTEDWPDDETIATIYRIIKDDLTPPCRRAMELRFCEGFTFAKVAEELGVSENAVYKHVRQALVIIRKKLSQNG